MPNASDRPELVLLIADNSPLSALSAIQNLDWLLAPGVPIWITDQVVHEATDGSSTRWSNETRDWIARNVEQGRVRVLETPTGRNFRLALEAWESSGRHPEKEPGGRNLGEQSILDVMDFVEQHVADGERVMVLMDERRGRKAMRAAEVNVDLVSTSAFFRALEREFGIEDATSYWRIVLQVIPDMDALDEVEIIRPSFP